MASTAPILLRDYAESTEPELEALSILAECGMEVARIVVVPPAAEAEFYRLNNLGDRLRLHFAGVKLSDPDDEDIEDLAPGAQSLVSGHFLLDEFIDRFYDAISGMPRELRVRRPGEDGLLVSGSRAGLLSVKGAWSADWAFEALWSRLSSGGPLVPAPRPLLLHPAPLEVLPSELSHDASALLGKSLRLMGHPESGISRIVAAPGE